MSRENCINCPQQHEPICCHDAINDINEYDQRVNDDADRHARNVHKMLFGTMVPQPKEGERCQ